MSLKEYRAKRDFTKSPEPSGSDETATTRRDATTRFFCVQKHLATALHYDFRLEHNGVLLSWAVPKGPSLDSTVKRLAMHVEDHPIEYGTFEGVIPEGYGAGVVMLWDQGTWTPEQEDVDAAIAKGDLKFTLDGYKLKGSWVLVRTRGWGGGRGGGSRGGSESSKSSWLLIKHRDDWAGPIDITTFAPKSVKSGGTFRDILMQETPDLWHSNRAAAGKTGDAALLKIVEKVIQLEEGEGAAPATAGRDASEEAPPSAPAGKRAGARARTTRAEATSDDDDARPAAAAAAASSRGGASRAGARSSSRKSAGTKAADATVDTSAESASKRPASRAAASSSTASSGAASGAAASRRTSSTGAAKRGIGARSRSAAKKR